MPATELAEAVVGTLIFTLGLVSIVFGVLPSRERTPLWLGLFASLYGIRLAADSELLRALFGVGASFWHYLDAFITYAIITPGARFLESAIGPGWRGLLRRTWQALGVYAALAIGNDLWQGEPGATLWLNPPAVVTAAGIGIAHVVAHWRRQRWSREGFVVLAGGLCFAAVALYETVSGGSTLGRGARVELEPLAMLVFLASLGYFVAGRIVAGERRLVAVSRELDLARQIQLSILPAVTPTVPGLRLAARYLPMGDVAGDFYDFETTRPGSLGLIVADVSGHGVPAALVASMVKVAFAAEAERLQDPGRVLQNMNRTLCGKFERAYVTACCGVLTDSGRRLAYSLAGHPAPLLRHADGRLERLERGGMPLTFDLDAAYPGGEVALAPGDRLLFFTDGLLEAPNARDEFFGDAQLARTLEAGVWLETEALADRLVEELRRWIGPDAPLHDDVTLVVVDVSAR
jgi:sigma-B regulation protein RsbU (phosphoserine phosphatase)